MVMTRRPGQGDPTPGPDYMPPRSMAVPPTDDTVRVYERVNLGNHALGYECRTCFAVSATEFAAARHAEWHTDRVTTVRTEGGSR